MVERVFEDRSENGKVSRYYVGTRIICDKCNKVLADPGNNIVIPYFTVNTHYRSRGMEVLESYKRYDYCSEECLRDIIQRYLDEVNEFTNEREIHIHYMGDIQTTRKYFL